MNTVSVVIPTYNRSQLVCETIESAIHQSNVDIEIIVVDDGSTDDTEKALAPYSEDIIYLRQSNRGVSAARNLGLTQASGDYIAFLDSDDLWLPFKAQLQIKLLEAFPDIGFVFSDFFIYKENKEKKPNGLSTWFDAPIDWTYIMDNEIHLADLSLPPLPSDGNDRSVWTGDIYNASLHAAYVLPSTTLVRRDCLDGMEFGDVSITHGDWEFFSRISHRHGAAYLDFETTLNRSHQDEVRLTRKDPRIRLKQRIGMIDRLWRQDELFSRSRLSDIDAVQGKLLLRLAVLNALAGDDDAARSTLQRLTSFQNPPKSISSRLVQSTISIPFGPAVLRGIRRLRHLISAPTPGSPV